VVDVRVDDLYWVVLKQFIVSIYTNIWEDKRHCLIKSKKQNIWQWIGQPLKI